MEIQSNQAKLDVRMKERKHRHAVTPQSVVNIRKRSEMIFPFCYLTLIELILVVK